MTMETATTTPENNDMIGWMAQDIRAARVTRTQVHFFDVVYKTTTWHIQK